jgi:hypothetical protein
MLTLPACLSCVRRRRRPIDSGCPAFGKHPCCQRDVTMVARDGGTEPRPARQPRELRRWLSAASRVRTPGPASRTAGAGLCPRPADGRVVTRKERGSERGHGRPRLGGRTCAAAMKRDPGMALTLSSRTTATSTSTTARPATAALSSAAIVVGHRRLPHRPTSELPILTVPQPYANHNGGQVAFGPTVCSTSARRRRFCGDPTATDRPLDKPPGSIVRIDVRDARPEPLQ